MPNYEQFSKPGSPWAQVVTTDGGAGTYDDSAGAQTLRRLVEDQGRPFVIVGRSVNNTVRESWMRTVENAMAAVDCLTRHLGVVVSKPDAAALSELLCASDSEVASVADEATSLPRRRALVRLGASNFHLCLDAGSHTAAVAQTSWLGEVMATATPDVAGFVASGLDRVSRKQDGTVEVLRQLIDIRERTGDVVAVEGLGGHWDMNESKSAALWLSAATHASHEARLMRVKRAGRRRA